MPTYLLAGLALLFVYFGFNLYKLIRHQRSAENSWDNTHVRMKMRQGELHKLMIACHHYNQFEQRTINALKDACERVDSASTVGDAQALGDAESYLREELERVLNTAEAFPETRADETLSELLKDIAKLNTAIAEHGARYDTLAIRNNDLLETFPASVFANLFGYTYKPRLTIKIKKAGNSSHANA